LAFVYCLGAFVKSPLELLAVRILHGISTGFVPASLTIVASSVPEERIGYSLGLMQTATLTGSIIGPLFGGILAHLFGIRASF
ncbi:MAG: MFS transporter, partial [Negativicutes bacterium]|nr:MFS transporter [Negativicutes bacterium]